MSESSSNSGSSNSSSSSSSESNSKNIRYGGSNSVTEKSIQIKGEDQEESKKPISEKSNEEIKKHTMEEIKGSHCVQNKESQRQGIVEPELIQSDDSNFINKKFRKRANSFKKELKSFEEISCKVQKSLGPPYDKLGLEDLNKFRCIELDIRNIRKKLKELGMNYSDSNFQSLYIRKVPSDDDSDWIKSMYKKAKCGGYTSSSSNNSFESIPVLTSSDKEVVEETKTLSEEPLNKGPPKSHKEKLCKNIHTTRKGPFAYKVFKEDSMPIPNTRIEIEKKNVEIKCNKIGEINYVFNLHSGLYQQRSFDIDQYENEEIQKIKHTIEESTK